MARSKYSDDTKAAVMAALLTGQSVSEVAKEYKIPRGTVANWSSMANKGEVALVPNTKKEEIGDLLISYLRANLATLEAQVRAFSNEAWLAKQNAADAAVLHGVLVDKSVRLIEALSNAATGND